MYAGARIVSFLLSLIAWMLLAAAVLVWLLAPVSNRLAPLTDTTDAEAVRAAKDAQLEVNLIRGAISAACVIVALVIMLFCDLVKAIINTARDTHAMLEVVKSQHAVREHPPGAT
jgi:hypothetical protein